MSCFLLSCAGWRIEQTEMVGSFPQNMKVDPADKVKIAINFLSYDHYYNGELKQSALTDAKKQEMIADIKQVYVDSNLFVFNQEEPDLVVDIKIKSEGVGSLNRAILTYATFFLIPSSSETTFTVNTVFKRGDGREIGEISKVDIVEKWQQLFLIFAMPFKYPHSALQETLIDLNRSTILEAYKSDYFREAID